MDQLFLRSSIVAGLLFATGCAASTSTGVPSIDGDTLASPPFVGLAPRTIMVTVEDKRVPAVEDSAEIVENVQVAVKGALRRSRFSFTPDAPHVLSLYIEPAEQGVGDMAKESCVQIRGQLTVPELGTAEALGIGCAEYRHGLGFSMGGGATGAYQTALDFVLQQLDKELVKVAREA